MVEREMRIVRLLDPEMCMACNFARVAEVENDRGTRSRVVHCVRLDCDNWDTAGAIPVGEFRSLDE